MKTLYKLTIIVLLLVATMACGFATSPTLQKTGGAVNALSAPKNKPTNEPKSASTCYGLVNVGNLNLRAFPDPDSKPDGAGLVDGDIVRIIGTVGKWYKVETKDGRTGYARSEYISRQGCEP